MHNYIENQDFNKIDFTKNLVKKGEYECCAFIDCNFSNLNLNQIIFSGCTFVNCNLSLVSLVDTSLQNIQFTNCKMIGINFEKCNQFGFEVTFETCNLSHSIFYQVNLKTSLFKNSQLHQVDFTNSNLKKVIFKNCDLKNASFQNSKLEQADFRTAKNFIIDPESNSLQKAKFSKENVIGLLTKYKIVIE